jgi:glutamate synthase domain-containing protein 1
MCGIVGYVGYRSAQDIILEGLHRLEYRGYDSAGVAISRDGRISVRKKAGRVQAVAGQLEADPLPGTIGIGHTRWATHGATTDVNSHPHVGGNGEVVLVHNGVIENHSVLRNQLQELGYVLRTGTDSKEGPSTSRNARPRWSTRCSASTGPTDWPSSFAICPTRFSARDSAARSSSASVTKSSFWPATPVR